MHHLARIMLPLASALAYAGCSSGESPARAGQASSSVREGYVDAGGGVRLFYRTVGAGSDTVVVLHGGPGFSMSYLAADLEPLAARRTLLFYDQRGAGRSTLVSDSVSLDAQRFAEDLEALRRQFGLERLTLLGHSWGAGVAALYAIRHPERVERLLLVDATAVRRAHFSQAFQDLDRRRDSATQRRVEALRAVRLANPGSATACRAYYDVWFLAYYADTAAARRSRGDFCADPPEALANKVESVDRFTGLSLGDWDWRPALGSVAAPALVIHGTMDFIPVESAREWAAALPNSRLLLLEGSGHFPYVEVPERFFAAAEAFLEGVWPAGSESVSLKAAPAGAGAAAPGQSTRPRCGRKWTIAQGGF